MQQLTTGKKISYAMGGMALNLANLVISQWLLKLYVPSKVTALVEKALREQFASGYWFTLLFPRLPQCN